MGVVILATDPKHLGPDLRWPLRIAAQREGPLTVIAPASGTETKSTEIDLTGDEESPRPRELATALRGALDAELGAEGWLPGSADEKAGEEPEARIVRLRCTPVARIVEDALTRIDNPSDLLVLTLNGVPAEDSEWDRVLRGALAGSTCEVAAVAPGRRVEGELLVGVAGGRHARAAVQLGAGLARAAGSHLTALYVEPRIGPDARGVGMRILDRLLRNALAENTVNIQRRVELHDRPATGLLEACADERWEVVLVGTSHKGAIGQRTGNVAFRLARGTNEPTLVAVRGAVPLRGRLRRMLDHGLQRLVPQLGRDERVAVVERIQSGSQWNFDFILLTALSTVIAALGLLDDSPAVIIGAMLVAPLMTPLLGLGIALAQGNPRLVRLTLKSVSLGFLTAFAVAVMAGFASRDFLEATEEMRARNWPGVLDLLVAFAAGLAAAYASGRPGLLAALPGVAIAAALLPPIATAGLAVSIAHWDLAIGATLLFAVNMVAIILAAGAGMWAVGIRYMQRQQSWTRVLTHALAAVTLLMALALAISPARVTPPGSLVKAIEASLHPETRLRDVRLRRETGGMVVQVDLGGARPPDDAARAHLLAVVREQMGPATGLRITHRYEVLVR